VALVVVGGHSRNIGKTSVVSSLIAHTRDLNWTAFKITQHDHGFFTADGAPCGCQTGDPAIAISAELRPDTGSDTARFLAAGAVRAFLVQTRQGMLAEAMPGIREELAAAENAILESNSLIQFLQPDLYLTVLDYGTADFKDSARLYLDRADAVLLRSSGLGLAPRWSNVGLKMLEGKPHFVLALPSQ
jgi:molybdopterin-guanine dinucleotide biosynthesis protein